MLELRNVSYSVGDKQIIKNVNLEISDRFVAITGPNGGGKTTLAKKISLKYHYQKKIKKE